VLGLEYASLREIVAICERTYCQTLGVEFMHITNGAQKGWIQERIEGPDKEISFTREGRRDKRIIIGTAETKVSVKTMSGDLEIRASGGTAPESSAAATAARHEDLERTEPMEPPPPAEPQVDVRDLLERVARGEVDVDAAAAALDARRGR